MLTMVNVASFQGLPRLQFLIACSMQKQSQKSYHVIRGMGITLYMYGRATEKTDLAFCTSYEDETSANGEQRQA